MHDSAQRNSGREPGRTSREELLQKFISTGLSKIVVYREDIDDIVGYIHIDEIFKRESD